LAKDIVMSHSTLKIKSCKRLCARLLIGDGNAVESLARLVIQNDCHTVEVPQGTPAEFIDSIAAYDGIEDVNVIPYNMDENFLERARQELAGKQTNTQPAPNRKKAHKNKLSKQAQLAKNKVRDDTNRDTCKGGSADKKD
jgi:hypothetical protein